MFKTMLWDPAGASALVQRQPDGNEVERAALRWGMGNPFPFQGGENNSDCEIHIHMYLQSSARALMGTLAGSSCQRDVTCALCGTEEAGQRGEPVPLLQGCMGTAGPGQALPFALSSSSPCGLACAAGRARC